MQVDASEVVFAGGRADFTHLHLHQGGNDLQIILDPVVRLLDGAVQAGVEEVGDFGQLLLPGTRERQRLVQPLQTGVEGFDFEHADRMLTVPFRCLHCIRMFDLQARDHYTGLDESEQVAIEIGTAP